MKNLDVCIVSYGGVGCTALMKVLSRYIRVNNLDDKDGLKHKRSPELDIYQKGKIKRVIYVYNNPMNAVLSLYRRHFHHAQYRKLTGQKAPPRFELQDYISSGEDMFQMNAHFHNWAKGSEKFPILLVNGATMYNQVNLRKILRFCQVKIPLILFKQKPRKSNYKVINNNIREGLEKIYNDFNKELSIMKNVTLIKRIKD